jgi:dolichol-phosphate mannosyltransferase
VPAEHPLLILIPTYNEAENVEPLLQEIKNIGLDADLLFVNDHSTDGTDEIVARLATEYSWVHLLQRESKQGIGTAHYAGIKWAYDRGYCLLLTMDADFTHSPAAIPSFLEMLPKYDLVIASRFLQKDSLPEWSFFRRFLTRLGHFMTVLLLWMPLDATGAFRLYRIDRIPRQMFDLVRSRGYSFFFESLFILWFNGVSIAEIPVVLPARIQGHSKMVVSDAVQSLRFLLGVFCRKIFARRTLRLSPAGEDGPELQTAGASVRGSSMRDREKGI